MSPTARTKSKSLPPPTASEAAFERAFSALCHPEPSEAESRNDVSSFIDRVFAHANEYAADRYATIGGASQFHTKLVGVSFEGRQDAIGGLQVGRELVLERQPQNPYDANALAVYYGAIQLGFVRKEIAKHLAPLIDGGARYRARIESLTGGGPSTDLPDSQTRHRGVNIYVWRDAGAPLEARPSSFEARRRRAPQDDASVSDAVRRALIGDAQPHEAQRQALERIEAGRNTLVVMGTGRGKSFCFQYPAAARALEAGAKTLVVYPLRALANDQYEALVRRFDPLGLRIYRANGSISHEEREDLFAALGAGAWDIVLATPEFLEFHRDAFTGTSSPSFVVVDEAHHLYESRHRAAYGRLGVTIAALGSPQVLALTATAGDDAFAQITRELRIESWVIDPTVRENLRVIDSRETKNRLEYLLDVCGSRQSQKVIVYCNSRKEATKLAQSLRKKLGDTVMFYHAGMPSPERQEVERLFREGALRVIVATSAFGEGIDLPDVRHVVLYHLNFDFTEFNQQAGRAGRDGAAAQIHLLFGRNDRAINEFIIDHDAPTLPVLRGFYKALRGIARDDVVHMSFADIARTLELDKVNERTVSRALRIFEDEGLVEMGEDDDGRYIRFLRIDGKIDLERNERFAEGEAERESFKQFCDLVLSARAEDLERIINRPIYPQRVELMR
ncbi:MAG TPA: helicase-related protein [Candidatus Acidoferrales bacterium]|nr:helicase-related protein [Candidatus Acidoferrales bacterium]